ncbi:MAG TPA: ParB/RepB/Spo0J family partition protein [Candidatus Eisenbacteria bacterium]|jgi:ParB family chromosome partitioning protein|nr:ParB/RepB/Spo0J family partition protein [Candidatus Eisenbacteria bacterium]
MERKVLGRGLDSLIPSTPQGSGERVQTLKLEEIQASRFQPRLSFSEEKIAELAQSIKEKGVIQPILVRAVGGRYELIAGERRWRAAKRLGLAEIPAIVRRVHDADLLEMSIIENIQREELNPLEEAKAYRRLAQEFGFTQDAIADKVGKDKSSVSNLLRILNLPDEAQDYLGKNLISLGHAKALLSLNDPKQQMKFCLRIVQKGLSVRQVESLVIPKRSAGRSAQKLARDREILDLEGRLQQHLGTKVRIQHGKKRGVIQIDYYSLEDLDRVLALLGLPPA